MLIATRGLQAVGGSALVPVAMSIIANVFLDPRERAQALGAWGAVAGVGMALGPLVGGALVDAVDWRAVFWVNLPIVAVAVPAAVRVIPESRAEHARGADPLGQFLAALALGTLTFGVIEAGELGFGRLRVITCLVLAPILALAFLAVERREREPMLELRFFRSIPFSLAMATALLLFLSYAGFTFVATLYLQEARGLEPVVAGLLTLPVAVSNGVMAYVSGWLTGRVGPLPPMAGGPVLIWAAPSSS
ncbi:MFS transporter [Actinomyces radicidentis]|uniref:MFS transporter n=1 Tax=Actinomyces radicidentis TaxID=111015 RepID=UPI0028EB8052|nr:MFS transporter [Actinomyces radicidentis]